MPSYDEMMAAAAAAIITGFGGVVPEGYNAKTLLAASLIIQNGGAGGGGLPQARVSGMYYPPSIPIDGTDGGGALTAGTAEFAPFFVTGNESFDRAGINVATLGSAGVIRLGIYKAHATTKLPDALVADFGTVDPATTGDKILTILQALTPGMYWTVIVTNSTGCSIRKTAGSAIQHSGWIKGGSGLDMSDAGVACRTTGWTAANPLPATALLTGLTWRRIDVPLLFLRKV